MRDGIALMTKPGLLALTLTAAMLATAFAGPAAKAPQFEPDVLPILKRNCFVCHGPNAQLSGLDLRTPALMVKGGSRGAAITPGAARNSLLYRRVAEGSMPPGDRRLPAEEVRTLRDWLDAGAPALKPENALTARKTVKKHWAFQPPQRPPIPKVRRKWWVLSPVDAFVLAKLEAKGIAPPPAADRRTLIRRVYLDLIGLPPTPEEVHAFLADRSPKAFEKVVDDLLSRPQYGERWARHWLDVVRYADTNGYERDGDKPSVWRYRDYVVNAFNADKPFDRFVLEQLAGDELPGSDAETQIATTFLRLGSWDDEPADPLVDRYEQLDDVAGTVGAAFMAITIRCARCHDHKFEPFSQKDYYSLVSVFQPLKRPQNGRTDLDRLVGTEAELQAYREGTARADARIKPLQTRLDALRRTIAARLFAAKTSALPAEAIAAFQAPAEKRDGGQKNLVRRYQQKLNEEILAAAEASQKAQLTRLTAEIARINAARPKEPPHAYIWYEDSPKAPPTHLLTRGDPRTPAAEVHPAVPAVLAAGLPPASSPRPLAHSTGRRLWLAKWLVRPDNPLTARVMVNRIWQHHFGNGLVSTENDFGVMGQPPSHPRLLDWLATEFVRNGWSVKKLQRLIVLSNTYKATANWQPPHADRDAAQALLWRWKPRRLEAEAVRDSILAVSGQLNPQRGGPGVYPLLPATVLASQSRPGAGWGKSDPRQASRRSLYIFVKRTLAVPELELLDTPDNTSSCEQRLVSTIAPQALTFLNGHFVREQAGFFANRLAREAGPAPAAQVRRAFELAFARPPSPTELAESLEFLVRQDRQIRADAGRPLRPGEAYQRALRSFCLVLLNANEFVYLN